MSVFAGGELPAALPATGPGRTFQGGDDPVTVDVHLNGTPLPDSFQIHRAEIVEAVDALSTFALTVADGDMPTGTMPVADHPLVRLGTSVEISLGYGDGTVRLFSGELTEIGVSITGQNDVRTTLRGYDLGHRLTRGTTTRTFTRVTENNIVARIGREAGLAVKAEANSIVHEYVLQSNQSDLDFLRSRARRTGHELFVRGRVLHYRRPALSQVPRWIVRYGENLISFDVRLTAAGQAGAGSVRSWDPKTKQAFVARATGALIPLMDGSAAGGRAADRVFGKAETAIVGTGVSSRADADQIAAGAQLTAALQYLEATCEVPGNNALRAGDCVRIDGVGSRFSGTYYLVEATHTAVDGNYTTRFRARRTAA